MVRQFRGWNVILPTVLPVSRTWFSVLAVLLFLSFSNPGNCCSSVGSKSSRVEVSNEIEAFPSLFATVDDVAAAAAGEKSFCPTSFDATTCKVVAVNLAALAAPKLNFPILFPGSSFAPDGQLVLKKTTEEGLKLVLADRTSPATATITYKVSNRSLTDEKSTVIISCTVPDAQHNS